MHCNLRQPDAAQSLSALISSPVPSSKSLSQSVAVFERLYCLYVTLRCDLELWPCDLDLWPSTCSMCCAMLWDTLHKIYTQSYSIFNAHTLRYTVTLTFDPVTLTYDLWRWTHVVDQLRHVKLCTKFERNRTIRGRVIAVWIFDLMTLNMYHMFAVCSGIVCTKFKLSQAICLWNVTIF